MAANGTKAEELLEHVLKEDFVLAVEGGVAAIDTFFLTIGAEGESGYEILEKLAAKAKAIFAVGTCSSYGEFKLLIQIQAKLAVFLKF